MEEIVKLLENSDFAGICRLAVNSKEVQRFLLEPQCKEALSVFVSYGHRFGKDTIEDFAATADAELVALYLTVHNITEKAKKKILDRKDDALATALIESGQWAPFPYSPKGIPVSENAIMERELELFPDMEFEDEV